MKLGTNVKPDILLMNPFDSERYAKVETGALACTRTR